MISIDTLSKLYIEITTICNLDCQMCIRRAWDEPTGHMPLAKIRELMSEISRWPEPPTIHLSGYGEPMAHPDFLEIVRLGKAAGARMELTTNGTLLTADTASALVDLDLDRLIVSIDAASPEQYEDIRVKSSYTQVIENLRRLRLIKLRRKSRLGGPRVGIAFVAMRQNIADLPQLPWLATYIGAQEIQISNLVPHTPEMESEILYRRSLRSSAYRPSPWVPDMSIPKVDLDTDTVGPLERVFDSTVSMSWLDTSLSARNDYCRFAEKGYAAIRWDGEVSPCLPLMHSHPMYVHGRRKDVTHYSLGTIYDQPLLNIWESPEYTAFRAKMRNFPFSPCSTCGGCERFPATYADCSGNEFPTCGGCLWAQGFVQCP